MKDKNTIKEAEEEKLINCSHTEGKKYKELFDSAIDAIFIADIKTRKLIDCNKKAEELTGYSRKELLSMRADNLHPKDIISSTMKGFKKQAEGSIVYVETDILTKKGKRIPVLINSSKIIIDNKQYMQGFFRDISEKRKIENELKKSEEKYRSVYSIAPLAFVVWDINTKVVDWNKKAEEIFGWKREEAIGKNFFDLIVPKSAHVHVSGVVKELLSGKIVNTSINENITKDGKVITCEWNNTIFKDEKGNIIGAISLALDITEKKKDEDKIKESEKKYSLLIDTTDTGYVIISDKGVVLDANDKYVKLTGYKKIDEIKGRSVIEWTAKYDLERNNEEIKKCFKKGFTRDLEIDYIDKNGKITPVEINASIIKTKGESIILTLCRDITVRRKVEEELRESEEKFRVLFESSKEAIMTLEPPEWNFTSVNNSMIALFKANSKEHFLSKKPWKLSPKYQPDGQLSKDKALLMIEKAMKEGVNFFEWTHRTIDGQDFLATVLLSKVQENNKTYLQATIRDITKEKKVEEEKEKTAKFIEAVISSSPNPIFYKDLEGKYLGCNQAFTDIMGVSSEEIKGKTVMQLWPSEFAEMYHKKDLELMRNPKKQIYEYKIKDRDGIERPVIYSKDVFYDEKGKVAGIIGSFIDITERKIAEEKLKESEKDLREKQNKYEDLLRKTKTVVFDQDKNLKYLKIFNPNPAFSEKDVIGKTDFDLLPREDAEILTKLKRKVLNEGGIIVQDVKITINNVYYYYNLVIRPIKDEKDKIIGINCASIDITERKKIEETLRSNEEQLKNIFDLTMDMVCMADMNTQTFIKVNPAFSLVLGYTEKELLSRPYIDFIHPDDKKKTVDVNSIKLKSGISIISFTNRYRCKDGSYKWLEWNSHPDKVKNISYSVARDITEKIKAEQALVVSEKKYRGLFESSKDGILILSYEEGKITDSNPFIEEMFGYSMDELLGKKVYQVSFLKDIVKNKDNFEQLKKKKYIRYENLLLRSKTGKEKYVDFFSTVYGSNGDPIIQYSMRDISEKYEAEKKIRLKQKMLEEAESVANLGSYVLDIKKGIWTSSEELDRVFGIDKKYNRSVEGWAGIIHPDDRNMMVDYFSNDVVGKHYPFNKEYRIIRKNDGVVRWVHGKGRLEFDHSKEPIGMYGTIQDITDIKQLDEVKSGFLSIASHQLRTPLSMTKWVLESMMDNLQGLSENQVKKIVDLKYSNDRLIKLVNNLLDVSIIDTGKLIINKKAVDINVLIKDLLISIKSLADNKNKFIEVISKSDNFKVKCDPFLIQEALENLLTNAIDYSDESSKIIRIAVENNDEYCLISVNNQGVIDPLSRKKISNFEKFIRGKDATSKEPSGSGLGLYITKKVIEANGGNVWFESNIKSGTTFYIKIIK